MAVFIHFSLLRLGFASRAAPARAEPNHGEGLDLTLPLGDKGPSRDDRGRNGGSFALWLSLTSSTT